MKTIAFKAQALGGNVSTIGRHRRARSLISCLSIVETLLPNIDLVSNEIEQDPYITDEISFLDCFFNSGIPDDFKLLKSLKQYLFKNIFRRLIKS